MPFNIILVSGIQHNDLIYAYIVKSSAPEVYLVNIHHHINLYQFFSCGENLIYSLSNFQIYNIVLLTRITMLYITSPGFIYLITGSLYLLNSLTHFFLHLRQPPICSLYEFGFFLLLLSMFFKVLHISEIMQYLSFSL